MDFWFFFFFNIQFQYTYHAYMQYTRKPFTLDKNTDYVNFLVQNKEI